MSSAILTTQQESAMPAPEWTFERTVSYLRWILVISIFCGLYLFVNANPGVIPDTYPLLKLGIASLVITFILHLLMGKIPVSQFHVISRLYDIVIITLLISLTGGVFFKTSPAGGIPAGFFLFLYPLLILSIAVDRPWYFGFTGALIINSIIAFFLIRNGQIVTHWNLFIFLGIINCAFGLISLVSGRSTNREAVDDEEEEPIPEKEREKTERSSPVNTEARERTESELSHVTNRLNAVAHLSRTLGESGDLAEIFSAVVEQSRTELDSGIAFLMMKRDTTLEIIHSAGISEITKDIFRCKVTPGTNFVADVILHRVPVRLKVAENRESADFLNQAVEKFDTILIVPLDMKTGTHPIGILGVANLTNGEAYTEAHEKLLSALASEAAMFIRQMKDRQDMERSYFELLMSLAEAIEAKDSFARDHVRRVSEYSTRLARAFRLTQEEVQHIEKAAILHDIGKVSTPEYILAKPGRLSDDEFEIVKDHVAESRRMLARISTGIDEKVKDYVEKHHERWDGKGYPEGLKGEEISLGAQIIALADTFDAMTSDRSYRKGFTHEEALIKLMGSAGTQFNPKVLHTFFEMMNFDINTGKIKPGLKDTVEMQIPDLKTGSDKNREENDY